MRILEMNRVVLVLLIAVASPGFSGCGSSDGRGGAGTGGASGTGGADSAATGGGGGSGGSTGGTGGATGGTGGATGGTGGGAGSSGCNLGTWPTACSQSGSPCSITVGSTTRTYYVVLPSGYTSAQPYPLVFAWHPRGGTAEQILNGFYNIRTNFPNAIYVSAQGLSSTAGGTDYGWPNTNGQDVAFTRAMLSTLQSGYCVDTQRIFSTGFSYGGIMSETLGCRMPDVFRALGVMAGTVFGACNPSRQIAVWMTHGDADAVLPISGGQTARDAFLRANHCGTTTQPVTPSPCGSYDGCDAGYPVVWCPVAGGGHSVPSFAAGAIAAFFRQF